MNYNKLSSIPPELGECENLEKLEMTANLDLSELPFEVIEMKDLESCIKVLLTYQMFVVNTFNITVFLC